MGKRKRKVVIIGGGFAGLNAAKKLGNAKGIEVTLIDKRNFHLFQPLLYQVAMAMLSPAEIAAPLRNILSGYKNIRVLQGEVRSIGRKKRVVTSDIGKFPYDYLIVACGVQHHYFGHEDWEEYAPGLKTLEQAIEIRRRVLSAFERAEAEPDRAKCAELLTFVVVGGGSTGVELAGAMGAMSRVTFKKDFKNIDTRLARVILIEAGKRILPYFSEDMSSKATRHLEELGVQVWTGRMVTKIKNGVVELGRERIRAGTILWAAGIKGSDLSRFLTRHPDNTGRVPVEADCSLKNAPEVFVAGDMARCIGVNNRPLPAVAPVAIQQGNYIARAILKELKGKARGRFKFFSKGQMSAIGPGKAILDIYGLKFSGFFAWMVWGLIHIYYLIGFRNRLIVFIQWISAYILRTRGARLVTGRPWRFYGSKKKK